MHNVKMCERCNHVLISNLNSPTADYYRHLSVKYCDTCREIVKREKTAQRVKKYKQRKKQERSYKQEQTEYLLKENEMMRRNYCQLVDAIEILQRKLHQIEAEAERIN